MCIKDVFDEIKNKLVKDELLYRINHLHFPPGKVPNGVVYPGKETTDDVILGERIVEAYNKTINASQERELWWTTGWLWECKKDIHEKLYKRNFDEVMKVLRYPAISNLFWGFESTAVYTQK